MVQRCIGQPVSQVREESKPTTKASPRLYDLTTLQRDANKRYGLSAKQTLDIAQALYERHKVLTYPRTDSSALPEDYHATAQSTVKSMAFGSYQEHADRIIEQGYIGRAGKKIFDNSKISDHFAIIPTGSKPEGLSDVEGKVFDLVVRRFLAAFHPAAEYLSTTRHTHVGQDVFKSSGRVLTSAGWLSVYGQSLDEEDEQEPALCQYRQGEPVRNVGIELKALKTKPPKPFTKASLLQAMETAGKLVDDDEMAQAMKERGLGTPATRAAIIEGLLSDGGGKKEPYLVRDKKALVPTKKAIDLIGFLERNRIEALTSPALTGDWEHKLRQVEAGSLRRDAFMRDIEAMTKHIVGTVQRHTAAEAPPATLACKCPACGAGITATARHISCASSCGFQLWREIAKHKLSDQEATQLIQEGSVGPFSDFVSSKSGRAFSAALSLVDGKAQFVFPDSSAPPPASAPRMACACPACGKRDLVNDGRTVSCGCGFKLWRTIAKKALTDSQTEALLTRGSVAVKGLKSAAGKSFDATLSLVRETGKVEFKF